MSNFQFTSESVSPGHPDKLWDRLSDTILDYALADDKKSKVACEVLAKGEQNKSGWLVVAGEITSNSSLDFEEVIRNTICDIGYDNDDLGFNGKTCTIHKMLNQQSPDIKMGVDRDDEDKQGAGDQGLMFGYATDETEMFMPAPIYYSHRLVEKQTEIFKNKITTWLRPDAKSQVTFLYENNKPKQVDTVVLSTQHNTDISLNQIQEFITEEVIYKVIPKEFLTNKTKILVNPTGNFVIGGPLGDCGLTGRKIIVDTYGGMARHGGGAFSGKDPSKVDRSAAYLCRYIAKNIVASGIAKKCEIQISYAIGVDEPTSISVNSFGTSEIDDLKMVDIIKNTFEVRPSKIIKSLDLLNKKYVPTSAFGHFGRTDPNFSWEETNKIDILRENI